MKTPIHVVHPRHRFAERGIVYAPAAVNRRNVCATVRNAQVFEMAVGVGLDPQSNAIERRHGIIARPAATLKPPHRHSSPRPVCSTQATVPRHTIRTPTSIRLGVFVDAGQVRSAASSASTDPAGTRRETHAARPRTSDVLHRAAAFGDGFAGSVHNAAHGGAGGERGEGCNQSEDGADGAFHGWFSCWCFLGFAEDGTACRPPQPGCHSSSASATRSISGVTVASSKAKRMPAAWNSSGSGRLLPSASARR